MNCPDAPPTSLVARRGSPCGSRSTLTRGGLEERVEGRRGLERTWSERERRDQHCPNTVRTVVVSCGCGNERTTKPPRLPNSPLLAGVHVRAVVTTVSSWK
eukprot:5913333-Prymnesium_polylepis.1